MTAMQRLAEHIVEEAQAETIRRQAFRVFLSSMRDYAAHDGSWARVLTAAANAYQCGTALLSDPLWYEIAIFAEGYGWPDTLRALASAMSADEQLKAEAMDRR